MQTCTRWGWWRGGRASRACACASGSLTRRRRAMRGARSGERGAGRGGAGGRGRGLVGMGLTGPPALCFCLPFCLVP